MKKITILLTIFCALFLNANLEWKDFNETFNSKIKLPNELKKQLSYLNEKNFYLYCYNDTSYLTNTNNSKNLRFIIPLIGTFSNKSFNDTYNENYNCNITANDVNISILDNKKSVLCINNIAYQHVEKWSLSIV